MDLASRPPASGLGYGPVPLMVHPDVCVCLCIFCMDLCRTMSQDVPCCGCTQGDLSVANGFKSVHPSGYAVGDSGDSVFPSWLPRGFKSVQFAGHPISSSTHVGFRLPPICSLNGLELRSIVASLALPDFQSRAIGVAHFISGTLPCAFRTSRPAIADASSSDNSPASHFFRMIRCVPSQGIVDAVGVGHIATK